MEQQRRQKEKERRKEEKRKRGKERRREGVDREDPKSQERIPRHLSSSAPLSKQDPESREHQLIHNKKIHPGHQCRAAGQGRKRDLFLKQVTVTPGTAAGFVYKGKDFRPCFHSAFVQPSHEPPEGSTHIIPFYARAAHSAVELGLEPDQAPPMTQQGLPRGDSIQRGELSFQSSGAAAQKREVQHRGQS